MGIFHRQHIWRCLEYFLIAHLGGGDGIGIQRAEARDTAKHPVTPRAVLGVKWERAAGKGCCRWMTKHPDVTPGQWEAADEFRQRMETNSSAFRRSSLGNADTGQGNGATWRKGTVVLRSQEPAQ